MADLQKSTYLNILIDTLAKKKQVLEQLTESTEHQASMLAKEELDVDGFEAEIAAKEKLIIRLNELDDGFMDLYSRVETELKNNKEEYKNEIIRAQELIREITELSTSLQAQEERNKGHLDIHLSKGKQRVREFKVNSRTAAAYYKNLSGGHQSGESYFFNRQK